MNYFLNFHIRELFTTCSDEEILTCVKTFRIDNLLCLLAVIDDIRSYLGVPITITSAFRSLEHNKKVGGVSSSQHMLGEAIDFVVDKTIPFNSAVEIIKSYLSKSAFASRLGQIIIYPNFIHMALRTPSHPKLIYYDKRKLEESAKSNLHDY